MSTFSNITVIEHENDKIALLIDGKAISERYEIHHEKKVIDELKALEDGQALKLFEQFIFSHTDLNLEHAYLYSTCIIKQNTAYKVVVNFIYKLTVSGQAPSEHVITNQGKAMTAEDIKKFIQDHVEMSLTKYTDLNYAY